MAHTNAILSSDKSAAPTVALSILCALITLELAAVGRAIWSNPGPATVTTAATTTASPLPGSSSQVATVIPRVPGSLPPLVIPPLPDFSKNVPSAGGLPPPPPNFPNPLLPPLSSSPPAPAPVYQAPSSAAYTPPASTASQLPAGRSTLPPAAFKMQPVPAALPRPEAAPPPAEPPLSDTGNAQADELLDVAAESRRLGDFEGALQALNRADLLVPNNPRIMREKTLTLQRLGRPNETRPLSSPSSAPISAPKRSVRPGQPDPTLPAPSRSSSSSSSSSFSAPPPAPMPSPRELLNKSFGVTSQPAPSSLPAAAPPVAAVNGVVSLGECRVERDASVVRGERLSLKVPMVSAPGEAMDPQQVQLDVFFYDKVNGEQIELSMADKPKFAYDTTGDFKSGREVLSVLYNLPEFTPREISELGRHVFYGYVVKLYYKNRLMGVAANPPDLSTMGESGQGKRI